MLGTIRKLCPKDYAWFIADCDFGGDCEKCELDNAPLAEDDIPNSVKDALNELIKIYGDSEENTSVASDTERMVK